MEENHTLLNFNLKKTKLFYMFLLLKLQLQLKNYFTHYYIETFLSCNNFFDILLVFAFFSSDIL